MKRATPPSRRAGLLAAALALAAVAAPAQGQALGRLFFTPEQRAELEKQRNAPAQARAIEQAPELSVNGVVRRSSGKATVWLDGAAHYESAPAGVRLAPGAAAQLDVRVGEDARTAVRVGETIDRSTGARQDGLRGGRIVVKRDEASRP